MSITDELRKYFWQHATNNDKLRAIADRIDAEHEKATSEFWAKINAVPATDENMAEHGWVRLPVDADGEVWYVGDFAVGEVNPKNPKAIERMIWYGPDSGWQLETDTIIYPCPDRPHHYHALTVEDVLREFAEKMNENLGLYTGEAIDADEWRSADAQTIAEYSKRLTLAEGEDA